MTEPLNRDEIIALLERLGGDDDADVLAAARALHAATGDAGIAWADLLVPEDDGTDEPAEAEAAVDTGAGDMDTGPDEPAKAEATIPAGKGGRGAEALTLIAKLLARSGVTEAFRDEMEGYKRDIADGAFEDTDYQYLVALRKRLAGKG